LSHRTEIRRMVFSPDGKHLLTGAAGEQAARLWETATGKPVKAALAHGDEVNHMTFSPDGRLVLTGSREATRCPAWCFLRTPARCSVAEIRLFARQSRSATATEFRRC